MTLTRIGYSLLLGGLCTLFYWLCAMKRRRSVTMDETVRSLMRFGAIWKAGEVLYQVSTHHELVPTQELVMWSAVFAFGYILSSVQVALDMFRSVLGSKSKKPRRVRAASNNP